MMKPSKKTYAVEYWACNDPNHRHKSEGMAQRCMEKVKREMPTKDELRRRDIDAAVMWVNGATYTTVAKTFGLSLTHMIQRIRNVLWASRKLGLPAESLGGYICRVEPESREHYLTCIKVVADFWGIPWKH